ncbi:hypothetical protein EC912_104232 [Luteibacter rhizovicinus]|uniref:Uncharacterized protein n=1 Tax=Luteibacter rhizovicinus TaxID=242606 RepID=A0A4R3YMJ9_9GAMM|nr:hypothetical protein [Luteibacter rhizovicinus]TCV94035.1 hypothetical protein EC912_104232 [Luteibacter rhizovicinus]
MNTSTKYVPSRRLVWTVAAFLAVVGMSGLAFAPKVAAAVPRMPLQIAYAWLCASLIGAAYVVVTLRDDAEGASRDDEEF